MVSISLKKYPDLFKITGNFGVTSLSGHEMPIVKQGDMSDLLFYNVYLGLSARRESLPRNRRYVSWLEGNSRRQKAEDVMEKPG